MISTAGLTSRTGRPGTGRVDHGYVTLAVLCVPRQNGDSDTLARHFLTRNLNRDPAGKCIEPISRTTRSRSR